MAKIGINMQKGHLANKEVIIGIDLGTTNSLVAYIKDGKPKVVKTIDGQRTTVPSVIHFDDEGNAIVGQSAKELIAQKPERTIYSVKRLLGKSYDDITEYTDYLGYKIIDQDEDALVKIQIDNQFYNPIVLSSIILNELKQRVENELGQKVSKAVITVPAYFNDAQRQATRDAGKLAGLDVLRIINEPTAASLAYGIDQSSEAQTIAVYDLGGGTFDISILRIENGIFEVLSTNGDTLLGGDDLDRVILNFWLSQLQLNISDLSRVQNQELRLLSENAKIKLGQSDFFEQKSSLGKHAITRAKFEELIEPIVQRTIDSCQQALKDAKLSKQDINQIVMVGGSTRLPYIKTVVSQFFDQNVNDDLNPDEVVAIGAAIQADVLSGNNKDILLLDITPLSLGIETVGGLMDVIIPRNSKIPMAAGRNYTTSVDGQKNLKVAIFQGERDLVEHNRKLGEFILSNIPPMAAGMPKIEISFTIDADGILKVKAKELRSHVEQVIEVKPAYGISEEDMARMLKESIVYAKEDVRIKGIKEAQNEANHILSAAEKFLEQNKHWLESSDQSMIQLLSQNLRSAVDFNDKDLINLKIEELNSATRPLAEKAMDIAISDNLKGSKI